MRGCKAPRAPPALPPPAHLSTAKCFAASCGDTTSPLATRTRSNSSSRPVAWRSSRVRRLSSPTRSCKDGARARPGAARDRPSANRRAGRRIALRREAALLVASQRGRKTAPSGPAQHPASARVHSRPRSLKGALAALAWLAPRVALCTRCRGRRAAPPRPWRRSPTRWRDCEGGTAGGRQPWQRRRPAGGGEERTPQPHLRCELAVLGAGRGVGRRG